tara:strand:+ start:1300 stop:1482 length:183 start_codon:yes stop_codon:yes gene_type:complete
LLTLSFSILCISWVIFKREHLLWLIILLLELLLMENFLLFSDKSLLFVLSIGIPIDIVLV